MILHHVIFCSLKEYIYFGILKKNYTRFPFTTTNNTMILLFYTVPSGALIHNGYAMPGFMHYLVACTSFLTPRLHSDITPNHGMYLLLSAYQTWFCRMLSDQDMNLYFEAGLQDMVCVNCGLIICLNSQITYHS